MPPPFNKIIMVQPAGIGDIIFTLKIALALRAKHGVPVIWPLAPQIAWLKEYLKVPIDFPPHYTYFGFMEQVWEVRVHDNTLFVPIRRAVGWPDSIMISKYAMMGMDHLNWQDAVKIERNLEREEELKKKLQLPAKYAFVNALFATPPETLVSSFVPEKFDLPVVRLTLEPGYTLLDWLGVITGASEVHMVSSGLLFILDSLPEVSGQWFVYNRQSPNDHLELPLLHLRKPWIIVK